MNIFGGKEKNWIRFLFTDVCDDLGQSKNRKTTRTDKAMTLLSSPQARADGARLVSVNVGGA